MLQLIQKTFIGLLTSIVSASNHTKCVSLSNQKFMTQPALINPNELPELCYYLFVVNLDRCAGSWNTLDGLSSRVCVQNETENLNVHVLNMITEIKEAKSLTLIECKFDSKKCNSNHK